jgi:hypothetical protein
VGDITRHHQPLLSLPIAILGDLFGFQLMPVRVRQVLLLRVKRVRKSEELAGEAEVTMEREKRMMKKEDNKLQGGGGSKWRSGVNWGSWCDSAQRQAAARSRIFRISCRYSGGIDLLRLDWIQENTAYTRFFSEVVNICRFEL